MSIASFLLFLFALFPSEQAAKADKMPGQKPLMLIGDTFQFTPGAWGSYRIQDKAKNESYRMVISILDKEKKQKSGTSWMEVEVETKDNPTVVTRFLAEETPQGPGKLLKVIVQVQGYAPFNVPGKYFKGKNAEVGATVPAQIVRRLEKKSFPAAGRPVTGWEVEAEDQKGKRCRAVVSEEIAPIGIFEAETDEVKMSLIDWGAGAHTRITGTPRNFTIWILEQMANEMSKPK
jgi:hypothetical protein